MLLPCCSSFGEFISTPTTAVSDIVGSAGCTTIRTKSGNPISVRKYTNFPLCMDRYSTIFFVVFVRSNPLPSITISTSLRSIDKMFSGVNGRDCLLADLDLTKRKEYGAIRPPWVLAISGGIGALDAISAARAASNIASQATVASTVAIFVLQKSMRVSARAKGLRHQLLRVHSAMPSSAMLCNRWGFE